MRDLTLCHEVLLYLMYENSFEWLAEANQTVLIELKTIYTEFHAKYPTEDCSKEVFEKLIENSENVLGTLFDEFRESRRKQSASFHFYDLCAQSLQLLSSSSRAQREANWELDISYLVRMLPYFFACNKINYKIYTGIF